MAERFQLPPVITASSWPSLADSLWSQTKRGVVQDDAGDLAPKWTNREAVSVVQALRELGKGLGFEWWYQFAALAYGWDPAADRLDETPSQADALYPPDSAVLLNRELIRIMNALETTHREDPRIELADVFDENAFKSDLMSALRQDGAAAQFKIPIPACKGEGGRLVPPVWDRETRKWKCPGGVVVIDDPLTALVKSLIKPAAVIAAIYVLAAGVPAVLKRRRKRSRRD
jgi:hypothetical protein